RVDAGEWNHDIAVLRRELGDLLVRYPPLTAGALAVDRKDDAADFALTVIRRDFRNGWAGGSALEILRHRIGSRYPKLIRRLARRHLCMSMNINCSKLCRVHCPSSLYIYITIGPGESERAGGNTLAAGRRQHIS